MYRGMDRTASSSTASKGKHKVACSGDQHLMQRLLVLHPMDRVLMVMRLIYQVLWDS